MDFYRLVDNKLKPAPRVLEIEGRIVTAPTVSDYAARGMYPYRAVQAEPREGFVARGVGFEVVDGRWQPVFEYEPIPETPKTYSKLKLYGALAQAGLWESFAQWLETQTVDGVNAYIAFSMAQELRSDNPLFAQYLEAAKDALGVTDEQVAAILAAAEVEYA